MNHLFLTIILISVLIRIVTARRRRRFYNGGYNPYQYGCRRRHGILGSVLPILALVALDRLFTGRRF